MTIIKRNDILRVGGGKVPRKARIKSETGYYHIITRGNNKNYIFKDETDKELIKEEIKKQEIEKNIEIAAWCIMDNHIHLVIKGELEDITTAMKKINVKYAMKYNVKYERSGHVFQDRYMSKPIETDEYLICVLRYVHMKPVKANIVKKPENYRWSSYREYIEVIKEKSGMEKYVLSYFDMDIESFKKFHQEEDEREYLEIKEYKEKYRLDRAQRIINRYCGKYGVNTSKDVIENREIFKELIIELKEKSGLSIRKISKLLEVSYGTIQATKRKSCNESIGQKERPLRYEGDMNE